MAIRETKIMRDIQLAASKVGCRLFRNNVGMAWFGAKIFKFSHPCTITVNAGDIVIRQAYPVHFGLVKGSGDLIGFTPTGRFISAEIKTEEGKLSSEQLQFINVVDENGGLAFVARSVEEALKKIK